MSIQASVPSDLEYDLYQLLYKILQKAVDGTIVPLFVDNSNQRVLVGAIVSAGNNSKFQVTGDIEVIGTTNGLIFPDKNGSGKFGRVSALRDANGNWTLDINDV